MKLPLRVPVDAIEPGPAELSAEAAAYVTRVHRLGPGDAIVLFEPARAVEADAEITDAGRRRVTVKAGSVRPARTPLRSVTLIQGIGKGDKMDAIARDATELSATAIAPAICARTVVRPADARVARWRRIAVEAARQCGRGDVPSIAAPLEIEAALRGAGGSKGDGAIRICLDPAAELPIGRVIARLGAAQAVAFVVGPEGGLTPDELAAAEGAGFTRVTLGPLVLRTETVCAAVLGALLAVEPSAGGLGEEPPS